MKGIILAGGQGTRLWPMSRRSYPKQFLRLDGEASLLQQTARRLSGIVGPENIVVLTQEEYRFHVLSHLRHELGESIAERTVLEPALRNTAPALALAAAFCRDRLGCGGDEVMLVCPSDHVIRPDEEFAVHVRLGAEVAAEGFLVTFGIRPTSPDTGYGYIEIGEDMRPGVHRVARFTEKPDRTTAETLVRGGRHLWNAGIFAFRVDALLAELERHAPEIFALVQRGYDEAVARFAELPRISIDYAVMERSQRIATVPMSVDWNDVGSWDALASISDPDERGNVRIGKVRPQETERCILVSENRLLSAIGVHDLVIVETADAVLVADRKRAQDVKAAVADLREAGHGEADELTTTFRPWGHYTVLGQGPGYLIKRVVVEPGERLSLQLHRQRSEHWVVVRGTARIEVDGREQQIRRNESAYIPIGTAHRLANPGDEPLELIEVQNGDYIGEDDIVRLDDQYGRK